MDAFVREHRLVPRGPAAVVAVFFAIGTVSLVREGAREMVAGLPMVALMAYGLAAALLNRVRTQVDSRGLAVVNGPVPVAPASPVMPRGEVAKVYVRHAVLPSKTGPIPYLAAGVQRADGRWYDVSDPILDDAGVWREARELAAALQWNGPVEELWGTPPTRDWKAMRPIWYWTGAVLGAMAWGCAVPRVIPWT